MSRPLSSAAFSCTCTVVCAELANVGELFQSSLTLMWALRLLIASALSAGAFQDLRLYMGENIAQDLKDQVHKVSCLYLCYLPTTQCT